jgi:hypothetical protein
MFAPGVPTPAAATSVTCQTAQGPLLIPAIGCRDGSALWQISGPGVAVAGWGFSGQPFRANDDLADPAWLAAMSTCRN